MRLKVASFFLFTLCMFLFIGCSPAENKEPKSTPATAEENDGKEEPQKKKEDESSEEESLEGKGEVEDKSDETSANMPPQGDYEVHLGGEVVETEDQIIISGVSNLLPGARVVGEVTAGDQDYFADTTELVEDDGSFYMEIAHHNLDKETNVVVKFHFDSPQDDGIKRHYGDRGQKLTGPYAFKHQRAAGGRSPKDIYQKAEVSVTFEPSEEKVIRYFKEPKMYEIPEDIGSPRVWVEVEDITDDQEFFYVHGRSNLLEGSKVRGTYHQKRDETLVRPDGSFDLKIEYEYRENIPFVIQFRPNDLQWNSVEEVYGKEGQNLVGDLVVTNEHNQIQFIELEVPLQSKEITVPDNVELTIDGTEVTMLVPDHLLFEFDEYALKDESKETLSEIKKTLKQFDKNIDIVINGHTDNVGKEDYNMKLSEQRAEEVKKFLTTKGDLDNINFTTKGYGATKPIASNDDEKGQAKNRRVEIIIQLR